MSEILSLSSNKEAGAQHQAESPGPADWGSPIPDGYGETCAVLMPRDPEWMFIYWEISESTARELKARHGNDVFTACAPILRQMRNGHHYSDVAVSLDARNWYLKAEGEGFTWHVELGLKRPNGEFILIVRSNNVTLPRGRVSSKNDERWARLHASTEELLALSGGGTKGAGSLEIARRLAERWDVLVQASSRLGSGGVSSSLISALRKT